MTAPVANHYPDCDRATCGVSHDHATGDCDATTCGITHEHPRSSAWVTQSAAARLGELAAAPMVDSLRPVRT